MSSPSPKKRILSPEPLTDEALALQVWDDLAPARPAPREAACRDEGYFRSADREEIYWQTWTDPERPVRGTVALMHGYREHSARYDHVALGLVRTGFRVAAIDARGHGRSTGARGYVDRFDRYVDDFSELKRRLLDRWPDEPLFVLGHSNGGLIALAYALRQPEGVAGFVLSNPMMGLKVEVPVAKEVAGRIASRLTPGLSLPSGLSGEMMSHLPEVIAHYDSDPLNFDAANARWYTESQATSAELYQRAAELEQPFLFLLADADPVVDHEAAVALFHTLGSQDRELEVFEGLRHEILNEAPWREILKQAIRWMDRRRTEAR